MRIALAQIISSAHPAENLELIQEYASRSKTLGAELVVFPEASMRAFGNPIQDIAEPLDGPWASRVRQIATDLGITIVAGMFTPGEGHKVRNTLLVVGPGIETSYDKIHLFDAFGFAESDSVDAGSSPVTIDINGITVGLATCYDVRFPALFTNNAKAGAQINIICASWGAGDGKADQWDLLIRARAVDSTTFVIACGQADPASLGLPGAGSAPTGIGRSAIISPLGTPLITLGREPELAVIDIDPAIVDDVRTKLPVLANAQTF